MARIADQTQPVRADGKVPWGEVLLEDCHGDAAGSFRAQDYPVPLGEYRDSNGMWDYQLAPMPGQDRDRLDPCEWGPAVAAIDWTGFDEALAAYEAGGAA